MMESQIWLNVGACVLAAVVAYLLGSISSAVIVSRIYAHDDVRKYGSKNAGMTNVLRTYGKLPALFTFLGDFFKGVLAVVIALSQLLLCSSLAGREKRNMEKGE